MVGWPWNAAGYFHAFEFLLFFFLALRACTLSIENISLSLVGTIVADMEVEQRCCVVQVVRDCNWHPDQPMLVTTSFDGSVVKWDVRDTPGEEVNQAIYTA